MPNKPFNAYRFLSKFFIRFRSILFNGCLLMAKQIKAEAKKKKEAYYSKTEKKAKEVKKKLA